MKIVLSRKGFDSSAGGHASPILPDGTLLSLPIPSTLDALAYADIAISRSSSDTYADVIAALETGVRIDGGAHLDPDLVASSRPRSRGWRAAFGQVGAAGGHLRNARIGVGDLFLFFGWFRWAEWIEPDTPIGRRRALPPVPRLRFVRDDPGVHVLFGYLDVGAVVDATGSAPLPSWLADHPHAHPCRRAAPNNTIYTAARRLGLDPRLPGAGTFRFDDALVLTAPGESRSRWRLDRGVFGDVAISYHGADAWRDGVFRSSRRGQEFVIDATPRIARWATRMIRTGAMIR